MMVAVQYIGMSLPESLASFNTSRGFHMVFDTTTFSISQQHGSLRRSAAGKSYLHDTPALPRFTVCLARYTL